MSELSGASRLAEEQAFRAFRPAPVAFLCPRAGFEIRPEVCAQRAKQWVREGLVRPLCAGYTCEHWQREWLSTPVEKSDRTHVENLEERRMARKVESQLSAAREPEVKAAPAEPPLPQGFRRSKKGTVYRGSVPMIPCEKSCGNWARFDRKICPKCNGTERFSVPHPRPKKANPAISRKVIHSSREPLETTAQAVTSIFLCTRLRVLADALDQAARLADEFGIHLTFQLNAKGGGPTQTPTIGP